MITFLPSARSVPSRVRTPWLSFKGRSARKRSPKTRFSVAISLIGRSGSRATEGGGVSSLRISARSGHDVRPPAERPERDRGMAGWAAVDRSSLNHLRRQPGYPLFYVTATLTRFADEMFSVGAVSLVLARTGSAALAGAPVAALTL